MRITESLAKLTLSPIATEQHVDEAIRLFLASTMDAVNQGQQPGQPGAQRRGRQGRDRADSNALQIGWTASVQTPPSQRWCRTAASARRRGRGHC